ncbi:MAG: peptidoglycan-binding domain-containing protein [Pseudomonadales bacterium]
MREIMVFAAAAAIVFPALAAAAQDARQILETAQQRQLERWEGVDAYVVDQTLMGHTASTWFVRTEYIDDKGTTQTFFVPMTETQIKNRQCDVGLSADELEAFAAGAEMTGDAMSTEIEAGMDQAGMPKGMLAATGSDPWNTMDPRVMMGGNAEFLRAAADAKRADQAYDPSDDARQAVNHMQAFADKAKVIGTETVAGRKAWHLRAEDLNYVEKEEDGEYRIEDVSLFVDTLEYVPLSMKMNGTMTSRDGTSQVMSLTTSQTDYRKVPGSSMYESYRQVMNMSGVLTPQQEAEMAEAQKQLAEFEKQKASMTPQQLAMMESMMGPQLKMMESMAQGKGIQFETVVDQIRVNPALMDAKGQPCPGTGKPAVKTVQTVAVGGEVKAVKTDTAAAPAAAASAGTDTVTLTVQEKLAALGYKVTPSGTMDTETAIAISQYQAENNLPVTGEPTPQLAGILSAAAASGGTSKSRSPEELQAAQQACLEQKMAEAQAAQQKKRGFGSLMRGVGRMAGQLGNYDLARTTSDVYQAGATVEDFSQAAKDLGLTEDDIAACQNPA